MPYKYQDPWHKESRRFMESASIGPTSTKYYRAWLDRTGSFLGYPVPKTVTLAQLRELERTYPGGESQKATQFSLCRAMLIYSGCQAAREWKFPYRARPKVDGVFLSDVEVMTVRKYAQASGPETELMFSLGVDNGLRTIDMRRLTMRNARELTLSKSSTILGKGRGGGKLGHLELSRMTERPLANYLAMRQEWVNEAGQDPDTLLVRPEEDGLHPVSWHTINKRITRLSTESGIKFRAHDLRRTYGHRLHLAGVPIETIARLMRHETINQSFRSYIGIDQGELRAAQDLLCPDRPSQ